MKIGVIGLGNIFQKAYLPTISKNRAEHTFYFASNNQEIRNKLKQDYGFDKFYNSLEDLLKEGIDACLIHSATVAHYELAKRCLNAGIHVFIDKPLSENYEETKELMALAQTNDLILMLGFNRRFAPSVEIIKNLPNKRVIYLEKNRVQAEQTTTFAIYDLFLHLVDIAVYLLDSPDIQIVSSMIEEKETLEYITIQLTTEEATAFLTMDMKSNANTELYRVTSSEGVWTINNLVETTHQKGTTVLQLPASDWENTLVKRGFEPMLQSFLEGIKTRSKTNTRQENVLLSHNICQKIIN